MRSTGVESHLIWTEKGRLGLYFLETGANQRPSRVIYDRDYSSVSLTPSDEYDWDSILQEADWFHVTGITPAISEAAAKATLDAVRKQSRRSDRILRFEFSWQIVEVERGKHLAELAGEVCQELSNRLTS